MKQILVSASLAIGTAGSSGTALAEPDASTDRSDREAAAEDTQPRRSGRFEVGLGYQPDDGFIAGAAVANDDLFGSGDQLALHAMLSQRQQLFLLHFADPHLGGGDLGLSIDLFAREQEWPGFRREGEGGALTLWRPIGRHTSAFLSYRVEAVSIAPDDSVAVALARAVTPEASLSTADLFLSSLRAGVEHSTVDGSFLPRRGSSAGAWIEAADHRLGSDADLVRGRVWGAHHRPLGPFTLHLAARAEGVSSRDPLGVPLSERLQLDGSSDVRGLAPGALGRVDPATGMALGGDLLMTGRAEIEVPIWPGAGLSGLVFADAGAVLDTQEGSGGLGASTGVGLLWRSPIGPLRFDWAVPLDGDRSAPRFLFSLGGAL